MRELGDVRVTGPELGSIAVRLLEVVADDLVDALRMLLEPRREPFVELGARLLRDACVRDVANERVVEAKPCRLARLGARSASRSFLRARSARRFVDAGDLGRRREVQARLRR